METKLLDYCWKHKLLESYITTTGKEVEVRDQGLFNRNQGPTFFNAKLKIANTLWVGNVQILEKASDWFVNGFDTDSKYDNIILVVCGLADSVITNSKCEEIPILQAVVPEKVTRNVKALYAPMTGQALCKHYICEYTTTLIRNAWLAAMQTEYIEEKTEHVRMIQKNYGDPSWDTTAFILLCRSFGFGCNDDNMEAFAKSIRLSVLEHYRDDLFQVEAIILGQAGLLELEAIPENYQKTALNEGYFAKLRNEYLYLAHKHSLSPARVKWNKYGSGPQQYPHVILSMLANLFYSRSISAKNILDLKNANDCYHVLTTHPTPYWNTHFHFGAVSKKSEKMLSQDRKSYIMASFVSPFLFCIGREKSVEEYCDRAFDIVDQMKPFSTVESKGFSRMGLVPVTACDTVALIQLQQKYCDCHDCLRCRFGFEFIRHN